MPIQFLRITNALQRIANAFSAPIVAILGIAMTTNVAIGVDIRSIGQLPGGAGSFANAVSADGTTVVGHAFDSQGRRRAVRWTISNGIQELGVLPGGSFSEANGVSADGQFAIGYSGVLPIGSPAFRWSIPGGFETICFLHPQSQTSRARATSADGSIVVGFDGASSPFVAFRWTAGPSTPCVQGLVPLPGFTDSFAEAISADGRVVVGYCSVLPPVSGGAFRWTPQDGMQSLGVPPMAFGGSIARAVSSSGLVVAGNFNYSQTNPLRPFRWTPAIGMRALPVIPNSLQSSVNAISGNAALIGGYCSVFNQFRATLWPHNEHPFALDDRLMSLGIDLTGWQLIQVTGISSDGAVIVGTGRFGGMDSGWVVTGLPIGPPPICVDVSGNGIADLADLAQVITHWGTTSSLGDVNRDGMVDLADIAAIITAWESVCD